jgi:hypothetical protein
MASVATLDGTEWEELRDATWIASANITADYTSALINCIGWEELEISVSIASTTDPIGALYVMGGFSSTAAAAGKMPLDKVGLSDTTGTSHVAGDANITVNDPAATAYINVKLVDLMSYVGLFYDRTSGGAATGLNVGYVLRRRRFR